jgi:hypothetical protein
LLHSASSNFVASNLLCSPLERAISGISTWLDRHQSRRAYLLQFLTARPGRSIPLDSNILDTLRSSNNKNTCLDWPFQYQTWQWLVTSLFGHVVLFDRTKTDILKSQKHRNKIEWVHGTELDSRGNEIYHFVCAEKLRRSMHHLQLFNYIHLHQHLTLQFSHLLTSSHTQ